MKLQFREITAPNSPPPSAGELYINPLAAERSHCRTLALLVVERGLGCLQQGSGPIETIVVRADPVLDDLMAALFASELLAGRALPSGAEEFAQYAAMVREGLFVGAIPIEQSMQGIFLAIRTCGDEDLTNPETAERFLADWARMARSILQAAAAGVDPFTTSPFSDESEFVRERTFLSNDRELYREDVERGEQWIVEIPGGPAHARALLLRRPKSLLFKYWCRSKRDSGIDRAFAFLAVDETRGEWVFSTDPVERLPINSLAAALQAAEEAKNPSAKDDPWFDGFDHTLVAAPCGKTKLADKEVLSIVREWSHARTVRRRVGWRLPAAALAAILLLGVVILKQPGPKPDPGPVPGPNPAIVKTITNTSLKSPMRGPNDNGSTINQGEANLPPGGNNYAVFFATQTYQNGGKNQYVDLVNPIFDATAIGDLMHKNYGFFVDQEFQKKKSDIMATLRQYHDSQLYGQDSELFLYFSGHGYFDWDLNRGYVVAQDSLFQGSPDQVNGSCISLDEINQELSSIPCRHVLLVLDTCFGGTISYGVEKQPMKDAPDIVTSIGRAQYVAGKLEKRTRLYLASAGREQAYDGQPQQHSPFAKRLVDYFTAPLPNGGVATVDMIYSNVSWISGETPQFGTLSGDDGGTFLFVTKPSSGP